MAGYTVVNLKRDVENSAEKFGYAPDIEARFPWGALELESLGMSYQRLAPGVRQAFGHRHKEQEEVYVVISGGGRVKLDDEVAELGHWDALRVAPETWRCFQAGDDGIEYLAFGARREGYDFRADVEMAPGWWSD